MRIAITSYGIGPDSPVDSRFHAAKYLLIYDTDKAAWDNREIRQEKRSKGHDREKVRQLLETGATVLLSARIDPLSFKQLTGTGVKIYGAPEAPVREAVSLYLSGGLNVMCAPDAIDVTMLAKRVKRNKNTAKNI